MGVGPVEAKGERAGGITSSATNTGHPTKFVKYGRPKKRHSNIRLFAHMGLSLLDHLDMVCVCLHLVHLQIVCLCLHLLEAFAPAASASAASGALSAPGPWKSYAINHSQEWFYPPFLGERGGEDTEEHDDSSLTATASGAPSASAEPAPSFLRDFNDGDDREDMSDFWRKGPGQFWKRHSS